MIINGNVANRTEPSGGFESKMRVGLRENKNATYVIRMRLPFAMFHLLRNPRGPEMNS